MGRCSADPRDKLSRDPEADTKAGTEADTTADTKADNKADTKADTKAGAGAAATIGATIGAGAGAKSGAEAVTTASGATGGGSTGGGSTGGMARVKRRRTNRGRVMGGVFAWWRSFWASVVSAWGLLGRCSSRCYTWAQRSYLRSYVVRWFTFHLGLLRAEGRIGAFIVLDRVGLI